MLHCNIPKNLWEGKSTKSLELRNTVLSIHGLEGGIVWSESATQLQDNEVLLTAYARADQRSRWSQQRPPTSLRLELEHHINGILSGLRIPHLRRHSIAVHTGNTLQFPASLEQVEALKAHSSRLRSQGVNLLHENKPLAPTELQSSEAGTSIVVANLPIDFSASQLSTIVRSLHESLKVQQPKWLYVSSVFESRPATRTILVCNIETNVVHNLVGRFSDTTTNMATPPAVILPGSVLLRSKQTMPPCSADSNLLRYVKQNTTIPPIFSARPTPPPPPPPRPPPMAHTPSSSATVEMSIDHDTTSMPPPPPRHPLQSSTSTGIISQPPTSSSSSSSSQTTFHPYQPLSHPGH